MRLVVVVDSGLGARTEEGKELQDEVSKDMLLLLLLLNEELASVESPVAEGAAATSRMEDIAG